MNKAEILIALKKLAHSQGFYGRLLEEIENDDSILQQLEDQNFKDTVDMILWLEG